MIIMHDFDLFICYNLTDDFSLQISSRLKIWSSTDNYIFQLRNSLA